MVKLQGLPFTTKAEEVLQFFAGYNILKQSLLIGVNYMKMPTGYAVVRFASCAEAQRAMQELQGKYIAQRYMVMTGVLDHDYDMFSLVYL